MKKKHFFSFFRSFFIYFFFFLERINEKPTADWILKTDHNHFWAEEVIHMFIVGMQRTHSGRMYEGSWLCNMQIDKQAHTVQNQHS